MKISLTINGKKQNAEVPSNTLLVSYLRENLNLTGAGPCVFRWQEAEAALTKNFSGDALENLSYPPDDLGEDIHASPAYRAHLISVMTRRALREINK